MDLKNIALNRMRVTFDYENEPVTIEFYPNQLTAEWFARTDKEGKKAVGTEGDGDCYALSAILAGWDVHNDGQPFPPTYENLLRAPKSLVRRAMDEVTYAVGKLATRKEANG